MGAKINVTFKTSGVLESGNFQYVTFGDITKTAMEDILSTISGGEVTTISEFNDLSNESRSALMNGFFNTPSYVKSLTIHSSSIKSNGVALGTDSGTITEVTGYDGVAQTVVFLSTNELSYGYGVIRGIVGASGYLPSEHIYSDIFLHDAGYGTAYIKNLSGCLCLIDGDSASNISTAPQADTVNFQSLIPVSGVTVYDGYQKRGYATDGNGLRIERYSVLTITDTVIKSINKIFISWSNLINTVPIRLFNNTSSLSQCGFNISKSGSYWQLSSPGLAWFDGVLFDGTGVIPSVPWTQTSCLEIDITDTYVKVTWNGNSALSYNLKKTGVDLTRSSLDTQIGTTARRPMNCDQASISNIIGMIGFFSYHPGTTSTTTPDTLTNEKIRKYLKRISLK